MSKSYYQNCRNCGTVFPRRENRCPNCLLLVNEYINPYKKEKRPTKDIIIDIIKLVALIAVIYILRYLEKFC